MVLTLLRIDPGERLGVEDVVRLMFSSLTSTGTAVTSTPDTNSDREYLSYLGATEGRQVDAQAGRDL